MLTRAEYHDLWKYYFRTPIGVANPPDYDEYVRHEQMLEDYKDLFRGRNTRGDGTIRGENTLDEKTHPFLNELERNDRKVRFILVAEARPKPRDGVAEYFYNYMRNATSYLKIVHKATYATLGPGVTFTTAFDLLVDLANRGVLLLDLFPFAIEYKHIRKELCTKGTTKAAWNGIGTPPPVPPPPYPENIEERVQRLCHEGLLSEKWDLALTAPPNTSGCILPNNPAKVPLSPLIVPDCSGFHPVEFHSKGLTHGFGRLNVSSWKKVAHALTARQIPDSILITRAFDYSTKP